LFVFLAIFFTVQYPGLATKAAGEKAVPFDKVSREIEDARNDL